MFYRPKLKKFNKLQMKKFYGPKLKVLYGLIQKFLQTKADFME